MIDSDPSKKTADVGAALHDLARTGWHSLGNLTAHRQEGDALLLECGEARVRVKPITDDLIRVRLSQRGSFGRDHSWAILPSVAGVTRPPWSIEEHPEAIELVTKSLRVRMTRSPCRISFHEQDGTFISGDCPRRGMSWADEEVRSWKVLDSEDHFFGLGEKGCPLDKRGTVIVNWNHDAAEHDPWSDPLYQTHPLAIVLNRGRAHGIFFDNTWRSFFDLGKTSRTAWCFGADGGELNYFFIAGPTPADVVQRYAFLVGTTPLPPRWALAYQQCRWSYDSAKRVRQIAREFRRRKIPCDAIYIDIDYMDGFRSFTWHPERFADPRKLTRELADRGFKLVAIVDPGIKAEPGYFVYDQGVAGDHFVRSAAGDLYVGKVWPGESVWPDYSRAATRRWWGDLYKGLLEDGVTGIWNDMNEPADFSFTDGTVPLSVRHDNDGEPSDHRAVHNVFGMQMARSTFEGLSRLRPNVRPFVLTRAGYSGVQRYAAVWTGDNLSSWEHLRMSIPMLLNMSISGISFCGADIGGFRGYPSPELFTRWLQLGVFYPMMRVHTAGGKEQDPWSFGKKHEKLNRAAIELRYQLLPYIYTEMQHTARTGLPLLRPVLLDYPDHPRVHRCEHEFLFGRQLYVAPVVQEGARSRKVLLPSGDWYDFDDGTRRTGGQDFELDVRIDTIPIFARAGAIVPLREVRQHVDEKCLKELTLRLYPGNGTGWFYNDDGISTEYEKGDYTHEQYALRTDETRMAFGLVHRRGGAEHAPRSYLFIFHSVARRPSDVTLNGHPLLGRKRNSSKEGVWSYDARNRTVQVRVRRLDEGDQIELCLRLAKTARSRSSDGGEESVIASS